jgi:hypothetical protein
MASAAASTAAIYDVQLDRIGVLYHDPSRRKYVSNAVLFDSKPGMIGAVTRSHRSAGSSDLITS